MPYKNATMNKIPIGKKGIYNNIEINTLKFEDKNENYKPEINDLIVAKRDQFEQQRLIRKQQLEQLGQLRQLGQQKYQELRYRQYRQYR